jgi:hypothetical protein
VKSKLESRDDLLLGVTHKRIIILLFSGFTSFRMVPGSGRFGPKVERSERTGIAQPPGLPSKVHHFYTVVREYPALVQPAPNARRPNMKYLIEVVVVEAPYTQIYINSDHTYQRQR